MTLLRILRTTFIPTMSQIASVLVHSDVLPTAQPAAWLAVTIGPNLENVPNTGRRLMVSLSVLLVT